MVPPHLTAALAVLLAVAAGFFVAELRTGARLDRFAPALASLNLPEAARGIVLQQRIFGRARCLPIYGSSELDVDQPTRPDRFFRAKRQGFDAFVFGQPGDRCLVIAQELASMGAAARGRKVAVFLSPVWFLPSPEAERRDHAAHKQFAAVFSVVHAGRLVAGSALDANLKRCVATRLLDFRAVIRAQSPLLATALAQAQAQSWTGRCAFALLRPLVEIQNQILVLQERHHWVDVSRDRVVMRRAGTRYNARRKSPGWSQLEEDVDRREAKRDLASPYSRGADSDLFSAPRRPWNSQDQDADFLLRMNASPEWGDLALLLRVARELDVRLLLVGQPINGLLSDDRGVTAQARREYYDRLSRTAAVYRTPLQDFSAFEEDRAFFMDTVHPSAEAWVHYDEALAQFFRRR